MSRENSPYCTFRGLHGSLVERQLSARGSVCSSPANFIIFNLGLSLSSDEMRPVQHYAPVPPSPPHPKSGA